jgi:hypothetical protein
VDHYDADKVLGLYKGSTALNEHSSHDLDRAMSDIERCTEGFPVDLGAMFFNA